MALGYLEMLFRTNALVADSTCWIHFAIVYSNDIATYYIKSGAISTNISGKSCNCWRQEWSLQFPHVYQSELVGATANRPRNAYTILKHPKNVHGACSPPFLAKLCRPVGHQEAKVKGATDGISKFALYEEVKRDSWFISGVSNKR